MLPSEKLAIAAHLHVLLRRKTGRVTDTEWMATNLEYAQEIVRFARAKAAEEGHADLAEWAAKLETAALAAPKGAPKTPLVQQAAQLVQRHRDAAAAAPAAGTTNVPPAPAADAPASDFGGSGFAPTGFSESGFAGDKSKKPREPDGPRYVGGIR